MMKKQSAKYVVLAVFALILVVSLILFGSVKINYNISDYLDESTETKISLNIIEAEFGMTGNIQVMVEDVNVDKALEISRLIKSVPHVLLVNFDEDVLVNFKDEKEESFLKLDITNEVNDNNNNNVPNASIEMEYPIIESYCVLKGDDDDENNTNNNKHDKSDSNFEEDDDANEVAKLHNCVNKILNEF